MFSTTDTFLSSKIFIPTLNKAYSHFSNICSVEPDSGTPRTIQSVEFSRPEYWSGLPFPFPGDLPDPGIKPRSPALQADSLPAEPQGKPKNTGVVAYPFCRRSSQPRN